MSNITYKMKIKPITRFHIGNGEVHDPMKFVIKDNKAYYLKELEYLRFLMKRNKKELDEKLALSDLKAMQKYYYDCFESDQTQCYSFSYPVDTDIQGRFKAQLDNPHAEGQIRAFIRSGLNLRPIIPGSSLKGAIRTAILSQHINDAPRIDLRRADDDDRLLQAETMMYMGRHRANIPDDPFKAIKISDADWKNDWIEVKGVSVVNTSVANRPDPRTPARMPARQPAPAQNLQIIMELGRTGKGLETEAELSIAITDSRLNGLRKLFPGNVHEVSAIIPMINSYYSTQLQKEEQVFRRMGKNAMEYFDVLGSWFNSLKNNECMLRIGMGSGQRFLSYEVMNHNPKSRKMLRSLPLGWLKITFEEKI